MSLNEATVAVRSAMAHAEVVTGMVESELSAINTIVRRLADGAEPSELQAWADELSSHVQVIEAIQRSATFGLSAAVGRVHDALRGGSQS